MSEQQTVLVVQAEPIASTKSRLMAYLLWAFFGYLGAHRFYLGRMCTGLIWLFTGGICGIGWLIDGFLIPGMLVAHGMMPTTTTTTTTTTVVSTTSTTYGTTKGI